MVIWLLARKEMRDALRTRWFLLTASGFALMTTAVSLLFRTDLGLGDGPAFGRTAAGLLNLILLVVPLMGLVAGALTLAGERERNTLPYLMAQPVSPGEVFTGKLLGLAALLLATVFAGLGLGGLVLGLSGAMATTAGYGWLALLTGLLALAALSLGAMISAVTDRLVTALGGAIALWMGLVFLGDLGLMATAAVTRLGIRPLFSLSLLNPLQVFRVAAVHLLAPSLEVLGPVGTYAAEKLGGSLFPAFTLLLLLWALIPAALAYALFLRKRL
ncbi:MAG: ABC transporter permease [Bacillota bacterium]